MTKSRTVASALGKIAAADTISSTGTLSVAGVTMIDSAGALPDSAQASAGDMVMTSDSNELFISDGSVWYSIALINTNPYFTDSGTPESTYALSTEGSTTTVTLIAVDSEGIPITYSAVADNDFSGLATISQDSSVFTITPLSEDSATTTSGTITFKASDGVNIATALSTFTLTFSIVYANNTVLLAKASGNSGTNTGITDSSTSSQTVTVTGSPSLTSFSPYRQAGYSYYFDGNGGYITCGTPSDFEFATNTTAWNIETWIYPTSSTSIRIFTDSYTGAGDTISLYFGLGSVSSVNDANGLYLGCGYYTGSAWVQYNSGDAVELNEWSHVAASYDGDKLRMFINGINVYESSSGLTWNTYTYDTAYIGRRWDTGGNNYFTGYMSDFKLVNGTAIYTANFTAPTDRLTNTTNTQLLTCHLPYLTDGSSSDRTLTISGNVSAKGFTPFDYKEYTASTDGGSFYVPGAAGNYLTLPAGTDFAMGTGDFTHEFWIYPTGYYAYFYGDTHGLVWSQDISGTNWFSIGLGNPTNRNIYFTYGTSGGGSNVNSSGGYGSWIPNMWHHVAVVRNSGTLTVYLNGKGGTGVSVTQDFNNTTYVPTIGKYSFTDDNRSEGWISDYRVVKGTAIYTADFTPPTAPLSTPSGTVLHLKGQEGKVYDNAQNSDTITLSTANSSTGQLKYASSNLYVSGSASIVNSNAANIFHDDGTLEFWMYPTQSVTNNTPIISSGWAGGVNVGWLLYKNSVTSNYVIYASSGSNSWNIFSGSDTGITPWTSSWKHIAITRNGNYWTFYVDGSRVGQLSSSAIPTTQTTVWIGSGSDGNNSHVPFYIEDLRFTKGLIRYPRIPAKETLTAVTNTKLLTAHTSSIIDGSDGALTATTNGDVAVSTFAPKQGMYSYALDGTGDYVTFAETAADEFTFGTGDLTAEAWVYPVSSKVQPAITTAHPNDNRGFWMGLNASNQFYVLGGDGAGSWPWIQQVGVVPLNTWTHIAYVRSGNTHLGFINGGLVFSVSNTVSYNNDNNLIAVGGRTPGSTQYFNGWISNARVLKGTALYSDSFTPPTAELKA